MALRWRPLHTEDVGACTEIVATNPVIRSRYGSTIGDLGRAWLRVLGSGAMTNAVLEEVESGRPMICGVGVAVFVSDEFIRELKTSAFWFGPELVKRVLSGNSPVLSNQQVRKANSAEGLNLLVWEGLAHPAFERRADVSHLMVNAFLETHRGYHLKEIISQQIQSAKQLERITDEGGWYWEPRRDCYVKVLEINGQEFISKPHIVGLTRDLVARRPASWVGTLFDYQPARFKFTESEQRLLRASLASETGTDRELAQALGVSVPTVKKAWRSIYDRVAACAPGLIPHDPHASEGTSQRGMEKRRRLLAYLRQHCEELRPVARG